MLEKLPVDYLFGSGSIFIDVGSWDNIELSVTLASMGSVVFAIDRYQRMEEFKEKLLKAVDRGEIDPENAKKIHPMKADANKLPFLDCSMDGVFFYYSTSWLQQFGSEILMVYKEVGRVLKEGGIVIISEPTVTRAKEQESFLKTQMKTNRIGTVVIGKKIEGNELPFNLEDKDSKS